MNSLKSRKLIVTRKKITSRITMTTDAPSVSTPVAPQIASKAAKPLLAPPGSRFDNRLFRNVKLTEVPAFLWENAGWNGFFRFQIWTKRNMASIGHPNKNVATRYALTFLALAMAPGLIGAYNKQKSKYNYI
jgi:hypothetical protein